MKNEDARIEPLLFPEKNRYESVVIDAVGIKSQMLCQLS